jgi:GT2 family glycosyltransferase
LDSVISQGIEDVEIIVVDNASTDGIDDIVRKNFPQVKYIKLLENNGCPRGRNYIYANCTGDYVVNLDDDGFLAEDTLEKIQNAFDKDKTIGVIAMKLQYVDEPSLSRVSGEQGEDAVHFYGGVSAFRMKMLKEIGYYPNDFFQYYEEADLALRVLDAGWRIVSRPDIVIWHPRIGGGGGIKGTQWDYYRYRNSLYVASRHFPFPLFLIYFWGRIATYFWGSIKRRTFLQYVKAVISALIDLPNARRGKKIKAEVIRRYFRVRREIAGKGLEKF